MNVPFFIARRYFLSKRKKNFINIISMLSMAGVAFTTAALIIVLSVFNGLGVLLRGLYTTFDPELKIELVKGKSFPVTDSLLQDIRSTPGVKLVTEVIEDYAYVSYGGANTIVTLKGMSRSFIDQHRLDDHMIDGELALMKDSIPFAILGDGLRYTLSADVKDDMHAMQVYYIRNTAKRSSDPSSMYTRKSIRPGGVFSIEKNLNENYMFVPIEFANELMNYGNRRKRHSLRKQRKRRKSFGQGMTPQKRRTSIAFYRTSETVTFRAVRVVSTIMRCPMMRHV
jgi:lipoprotein-releasing system permease protein